MCIGVIFAKCFWNEGVVFDKLKKVWEIILKRSIAFNRHFKNGHLFKDMLIIHIDNHINLLLDKCEGTSQPEEIKSYFPMNHMF